MSNPLENLAERFKQVRTNPTIDLYVPHQRQREFHSSKARGRLFLGGNRSGKTVGGGIETVKFAKGEGPFRAPTRGRIVTVDFEEGCNEIILPELRKWIPPSLLKNGSWEDSYDKRAHKFEFENKSTIEIMTFEQDVQKFVGTSRHYTWFDEEPPEDVFNECMQRLIDTKGFWWCTMTPIDGLTWIYDRFVEPVKKPKNFELFFVSVDDNPHVDTETALDNLDNFDEQERESRRHGLFVPKQGFIYASYLRDSGPNANVIEEWEPTPETEVIMCLDHGFTNPTAVLYCGITPDNELIAFDEYYEKGRTISENAHFIMERNQRYPKLKTRLCDPALRQQDPVVGNSLLVEYAKHGLFLLPADNSQAAGLDAVRQYLRPRDRERPRLFISKRGCPTLLWEMKKLQFAEWQNKRTKAQHNSKEEQKKVDDHLCDDLRYIVLSRPTRSIGSPAEPVKPPADLQYSTALDPSVPRKASVTPNRSMVSVDSILGDEW